jgi:hypothetical protein
LERRAAAARGNDASPALEFLLSEGANVWAEVRGAF